MERTLERTLFASRWLMAPMYLGLVLGLVLLLISFGRETLYLIEKIPTLTQNDAILGVLTLIDLSLAANLLIIVILSGYENFVSRLEIGDHKDVPAWFGSVDFSELKMKLVASIVAISGIHLLKVFMDLQKITRDEIMLMVMIHLVFVVSGVLLAFMDWIAAKTKSSKKA
ncbi:MAG: TIGR00645 family protein [Holosporales bacterium]